MKRARKQKLDKQIVIELTLRIRQKQANMGGRKLYFLLKEEFVRHHIKIGRDKFFEVLKEAGLLVHRRRSYRRTTNSNHWLRKYPNLLKEIEILGPEHVWVSDITYIQTNEGYRYLSLVTDACSKKIVGYSLSKSLESKMSIAALKMALKSRTRQNSMIHHSDRGIQYCSKEYVKLLRSEGIRISMTNNGDPYENAIAERVNGILKEEYLISDINQSYNDAVISVKQAIELYNNERPHLSCEMLTPNQAHSTEGALKMLWKNYPHRKSFKDKNLE